MAVARMLELTYLALLMVLPGPCVWGQDTPVAEDGQADAIGYAQAYAANMDSLRSFDLMIAGERFRGDAQRPFEVRYFQRVLADYDAEKFLLLQEVTRRVFASDPEDRVERRLIHGFYVDGKAREVWKLGSGDRPRQVEVRSADGGNFAFLALRASGFSNPRLVGIEPYPALFHRTDSVSEYVRSVFSLSRVEDMTLHRIDSDRVAIVTTDRVSPVSAVRMRYQFDIDMLVPVAVVFEKGNRGVFTRVQQESVEWKKVNGHLVPIAINGEQLRQRSRTNPELLEEHYNVLLRWNVINEPDQMPSIEAGVLANMERIVSLLREAHDIDDGNNASASD